VQNKQLKWTFCAGAAVAMLWSGMLVGGHAQSTTASAGSTAAQKFKNIQVLKDIPTDQVIPSMQFISASLGVECDFCHVESGGNMAFDKDDKDEKKTARKMIEMMFAINKNNFDGEREVTCNTCHRGAAHPQAIPAVVAEVSKPEDEPKHEHAMKLADMPSGAPILAKYIEALGGTAALGKVSSRVEKGKAITPDGGGMPITIYTQAPDKRVSVMHTPKGDSVTAYNGQGGWLTFPGRPLREMSGEDQRAAKIDAEAFYPNLLQQQFTALKLKDTDAKVGDRETNLVLGINKGQPPVEFYFDKSSGLLVRMMHYTNTALGLNPIQVDFADYRAVDGVQTPYRWTLARPSGAFTIQIDDVQQNVPIEAARFEEPTPAPALAPAASSAPGQDSRPAPLSTPQGPKPPQNSVPQSGSSTPAPGIM
jgi:photosynthetic reaction center cytochrome c subunit